MSFIAVIHNAHLTFNGIQYFRAAAESITIGAYGEKRTPLTGQNYLEAQDDLPASSLVVRQATIADIDFTRSKAADVKAGLRVVNSSVDVNAAFNGLKEGSLKLVKLEMRLADVRDAVNGSSAALRDLRDYGRDARVAHQIFVVMEATLAQTFAAATNIDFARERDNNKGLLKITATASASVGGSTFVTLSAGTTFAYLLAKPDWERRKERVEKFVDDQWSFS